MEEEINSRKVPNTAFSILLFLFFYQLIRNLFNDIPALWANWRDTALADDEPLLFAIMYFVLYVVLLILSFWSIIRMLKGKSDSIVCLRWALSFSMLVSIYKIFGYIGKAILIHWLYIGMPLLQLLLAIIFLIYLLKSN